VHPAGNRTGDLSLMRRGWYQKTIASALVFDTENDIKNAFDGKTHIQTAHPKRKCNRPLRAFLLQKNLLHAPMQREH
jgi:hypothetical protein